MEENLIRICPISFDYLKDKYYKSKSGIIQFYNYANAECARNKNGKCKTTGRSCKLVTIEIIKKD
jgi:hypothetical protein